MTEVKVVTEDKAEFLLQEAQAQQLAMVWNAFTDLGSNPQTQIPLPSVTKTTFEAIRKFLIAPKVDKDNILKQTLTAGEVSLKDILLAAQFLQASELCDAISRLIVARFFDGLEVPAENDLDEEQKAIMEKLPKFD